MLVMLARIAAVRLPRGLATNTIFVDEYCGFYLVLRNLVLDFDHGRKPLQLEYASGMPVSRASSMVYRFMQVGFPSSSPGNIGRPLQSTFSLRAVPTPISPMS
jgi:hypothetical protein